MTQEVQDQPRIRDISRKGQRILETLPQSLKEGNLGRFVAIEVESGDYFVAETALEATRQARAKYPERVFFLGRMGYRTAYTFKGRR